VTEHRFSGSAETSALLGWRDFVGSRIGSIERLRRSLEGKSLGYLMMRMYLGSSLLSMIC